MVLPAGAGRKGPPRERTALVRGGGRAASFSLAPAGPGKNGGAGATSGRAAPATVPPGVPPVIWIPGESDIPPPPPPTLDDIHARVARLRAESLAVVAKTEEALRQTRRVIAGCRAGSRLARPDPPGS
jgi:hypothetical protein